MENNLHDSACERAVIAGICLYNKLAFLDVRDILTDDCFSHTNAVIYASLKNILDKDLERKIDLPSIFSSAKEIGIEGELANDIKYVKALFSFSVELSNVRGFAVKLRKLSEYKQLLAKLDEAAGNIQKLTGNETLSEATTIVEQPLFDFTSKLVGNSQQVQQIGTGVDEYLQYLKDNPNCNDGVAIGYPKYEKLIGGLNPGVHIVSARLKTGKSFFALNASIYSAAIAKIKTLVIDTELRLENGGWIRYLTRLADGVEHDEIKYSTYLENDLKVKKVEKAARILKNIPLKYINITGRSFEEMLSIIRRWIYQDIGYNEKGKLNKCLVVFDYLKLNDYGLLKSMDEYQVLGHQMNLLHDISQQLGFPILTFVQLNREMQISASDRLGWGCSSHCTFIKKTEEELAEDRSAGNLTMYTKDCRFGEGLEPGDYLHMNLNGRLAKLSEGKTRNERQKEIEESKLSDEDSACIVNQS